MAGIPEIPDENSLFVGGRWVACPASLDVFCPTDGSLICRVPQATPEIVHEAVVAAKAAFSSWGITSGGERAGYLRAIAAKIRQHKESLGFLEAVDCGKPVPEAEWDMDDVATTFDYFATLAERLESEKAGREVDLGTSDFHGSVTKFPVGVVAAITPWNYPLLMLTWKIAPALAAGCTMVIKPSELSPLTSFKLAKFVEEVGLPAGVLSIITGAGAVGANLVAHPLVDKVTFTGSVPTGQKVMCSAAADVKNVSLELGGKSCAIIFDNVDIVRTVEWIMFGCFWTNGQICSSTSRVLIQRNIYPQLIHLLTSLTEEVRIGSPLERSTKLGPLVSQGQRERVRAFVERAKLAPNVKVLCGGSVPEVAEPLRGGYYFQPTVLEVSDPSAEVWQEEIFGPVLSVMPFTTEDEAIQLANNTRFGLAGAVFSADEEQLLRVGARLEAGIVWQNCSQPCFPQLPWGGVKQSGIGRDLGWEGLQEYLQTRQTVTYKKDAPFGWYLADDEAVSQARAILEQGLRK